MDRRSFIKLSCAASALGAAANTPVFASNPARIRAIAFDALAVLDPRPVAVLAEKLFPGKGAELTNAWRVRQFEYTWLRNSMGRYADFRDVSEEALAFAARSLGMRLGAARREQMLEAFLHLRPWSDVPATLAALRDADYRLALLSNFSAAMLDSAASQPALEGLFEHRLSTDLVRVYKPDPRAYRLGVDAFALEREQIAFVAFGGWDAAGAKSFGYPTYWCNRFGAAGEELGVEPDQVAADLSALPAFVR